jgi:hypothetical protein
MITPRGLAFGELMGEKRRECLDGSTRQQWQRFTVDAKLKIDLVQCGDHGASGA